MWCGKTFRVPVHLATTNCSRLFATTRILDKQQHEKWRIVHGSSLKYWLWDSFSCSPRFKELIKTNSKGMLTKWYALRAMLFELCHLSRIIEFFRRLRYCAESFLTRLTDSTEQTRSSFFFYGDCIKYRNLDCLMKHTTVNDVANSNKKFTLWLSE